MMFPKPNHKKQRSQHKSNPRLDGSDTCEICDIRIATETHELRGGKGYRLICQELGFVLKLCRHCHDDWHLYYTKDKKNYIRADKQRQVMTECGMTEEGFRERIGKSWL